MFSEKNALLLSLLVVALCYANALPNDFVLDDVAIVGSNPAVRSITPLKFLRSPYWAEQQYGGIYRPFTVFSLSVDYAIWQRWAPGFRITNLLVHALNGWLVFLLSARIVGGGIAPLAAMLIYVAHPVNTEAVTSIVGRSELFATCFFLSAWLLFRRGHVWLAAPVFFLSLLSKENAIVLPAILLLDAAGARRMPLLPEEGRPKGGVVFTSLRNATPSAALRRLRGFFLRPHPPLPGEAGKLVVMGLVAVVYLGLRYAVLGGLGIPVTAQYMGGKLSYLERWMTSGRVLMEYFRLIVAPLNVAGDYDFNAIPIAGLRDWDAWLGLLLVAGTLGVAYACRRWNWPVTLGLLFALTAFIPVSNWIMPISILMAERSLYLPLVGLSLVGGVMFRAIRRSSVRAVAGVGWLAIAVVICIDHDYIWRNDFTFFRNMVRVQPDSAKARLGYGFTLLGAGFKQEAAEQLEQGLRILPDYPALLSTLALTKMTETSCAEAWPLLRRALEVNPKHGDTLRRVADCLYREGEIEKAEAAYRAAIERIPFPDSLLLFMWGKSLEETGRKDPAIAAYERAAIIDPKNVFIQQKLASLGAATARTQ